MAVPNFGPRTSFCIWSVRRMDAVAGKGTLSRHESQQFLFLCADRHPCPACARRAWRANLCYSQAKQVGLAAQPDGCGLMLLAFYGRSLAVPDLIALDQTVKP